MILTLSHLSVCTSRCILCLFLKQLSTLVRTFDKDGSGQLSISAFTDAVEVNDVCVFKCVRVCVRAYGLCTCMCVVIMKNCE